MNISLTSTRAQHLLFRFNDQIEKDNVSLSYEVGTADDDNQFFAIKFRIEIRSEKQYEMELDYIADFETDQPIDDEFISSHFPRVNAPAIAYPFVRSYVSTIILNSGFEPLILPTINFQAMSSDLERK